MNVLILLSKIWRKRNNSRPSYLDCLKRCAFVMMVWNKTLLCSLRKTLFSNQKKFEEIQTRVPTEENIGLKLKIESEINKFLETEEIMWHQKAIIN